MVVGQNQVSSSKDVTVFFFSFQSIGNFAGGMQFSC